MGVNVEKLPDWSSGVNSDRRTVTENYRVTFDTIAEASPVKAETADDGTLRVPAYGTGHPDDFTRVVTDISPRPVDGDRRVFVVRVEYQSGISGPGAEFQEAQTEEGLPTIQIGSVQRVRAITKDINGNPIVNSAGDPPEAPPEVDDSDSVLVVRGSVAFDPDLPAYLKQFRETLNEASLFGFAADELRLIGSPALAVRRDADGIVWWDTEITWHQGDWELELIDNGTHQASYETTNTGDPLTQIVITDRKRIVDSDGNPVSEPVLLDGNGEPLGSGTPVTLTFTVRESADHTAMLETMGLPTTLAGYANL